VLARHGYGVLLFDARGHGRSEGRAMDFGWFGDLDVSAAVSFLVARAVRSARALINLDTSGPDHRFGGTARFRHDRAHPAGGSPT
jgi:uncharacterized protein